MYSTEYVLGEAEMCRGQIIWVPSRCGLFETNIDIHSSSDSPFCQGKGSPRAFSGVLNVSQIIDKDSTQMTGMGDVEKKKRGQK
jgi:hypothetical protein